ncbi:hypothetical protein CGCF415_v000260 [Colletotrichum fructicola]|nr:hypothetical protein CGCF415_v000260 [Colletotrichum fructicola]KAF4942254.1 hypothetical protein CGCF245_v000833 [Colletotrichum fructicola]
MSQRKGDIISRRVQVSFQLPALNHQTSPSARRPCAAAVTDISLSHSHLCLLSPRPIFPFFFYLYSPTCHCQDIDTPIRQPHRPPEPQPTLAANETNLPPFSSPRLHPEKLFETISEDAVNRTVVSGVTPSLYLYNSQSVTSPQKYRHLDPPGVCLSVSQRIKTAQHHLIKFNHNNLS